MRLTNLAQRCVDQQHAQIHSIQNRANQLLNALLAPNADCRNLDPDLSRALPALRALFINETSGRTSGGVCFADGVVVPTPVRSIHAILHTTPRHIPEKGLDPSQVARIRDLLQSLELAVNQQASANSEIHYIIRTVNTNMP